jgi:hypothetical protein
VAVLGNAATRGVRAQPVRSGAEFRDAAELHPGPPRESLVRRERTAAAASTGARSPRSAEQRTPDVSGIRADRPGAVWRGERLAHRRLACRGYGVWLAWCCRSVRKAPARFTRGPPT